MSARFPPRPKDQTLQFATRHGGSAPTSLVRVRARRMGLALAAACVALVAIASVMATPAAAVTPYGPLPGSAEEGWVTDGTVEALAASPDGSRVYVGGSFSFFGPPTGGAVPVGYTDGEPIGVWPEVSGGAVGAVISDGAGGWYVAGAFTHVDGEPSSKLIHVRSDGTLDPVFNASPTEGSVRTMALRDGRLYVGGSFNKMNGLPRNGFAVLDAGLGTLVGGFAAPDDSTAVIHSLALTSEAIIVGGGFVGFGNDAGRQHLVALNLTGTLTSWSLQPTGPVTDVVVSGSDAFVAGSFAEIGGIARTGLAKVSTTGGTDATFDPAVYGGSVHAIRLDSASSYLYAGGDFGTIDSSSSPRLARLDAVNGNPDGGWAPSVPSNVKLADLLVRAGDVIAAGWITSAQPSDTPIRTVVSYSTVDATRGAFEVDVEGPVYALATDGSRVYVGGHFTTADGAVRRNLAAIERTTGRLSDWRPSTRGRVLDLDVLGNVVYVGGRLGTITADGTVESRTKLAAIDSAGSLLPWDPSTSFGSVRAIAADPTTGRIFVGGAGPYGAMLQAYTSNTTSATVDPGFTLTQAPSGGEVDSLDVESSNLAVGTAPDAGSSASISVYDQSGSKQFSTAANGTVNTVDLVGTDLYAGGEFTAPAQHVAKFTDVPNTGTLVSWGTVSSAPVRAIAATSNEVFLAADRALVALKATDGTPLWTPDPTMASAHDILLLSNAIVFGGHRVAVNAPRPLLGLVTFHAGTDSTVPLAAVQELVDVPGSADGTYVQGSKAWFRGDGTVEPRVAVRVRAHDQWLSGQSSYDEVSGLRSVTWPAPSGVGMWKGDGTVTGAPRGLRTQCWKAWTPGTGTHLGWAIDRAIDYGADPFATRRPDRLPLLPAQLASDEFPAYDDTHAGEQVGGTSLSYQRLSCQWDSWIVAPTAGGNVKLEAVGDNGYQATVEGYDLSAVTLDTTWQTFEAWSSGARAETPSKTWTPSQARSLRLQWWENDGGAFLQLGWDQSGTFAAIPPVAYVTDVDYWRVYRLDTSAPLPASTAAATQAVVAKDRAGNSSSASADSSFELINDVTAPAVPTLDASQPGPWVVPNLRLTATPPAEAGSGVEGMRLERQTAPLDPAGACDEGSASSWDPADTTSGNALLDWTDTDTTDLCRRYRLVATDRVGNRSGYGYPGGATHWFRVDTADPDVSGVTFLEPSGWSNAVQLSYSGVPTDTQSAVHTWFERQSAPRSGTSCGTSPSGWTVASTVDPPLPHSVTSTGDTCEWYKLVVVDEAGRRVELGGTAVTWIDLLAPSGTIDNDSATPLTGDAPIYASATDLNGLVGRIRLDYTGPSSGFICDVAYTASPSSCSWNTSNLADGTYQLILVATDAAGNPSAAVTKSFVVDNTAPTLTTSVTAVTAAAGQHVDPSDPTRVYVDPSQTGSLTWDPGIDDGAGSGTSTVTWGADPTGFDMTGATAAPYTATIEWTGNDPALLAATEATFTVDVVDGAGFTATGTLTIIVDDAAPTGGSITYAGGTGTSPKIALDVGSDAGSGLGRAELVREHAPRTATGCGSFGSPTVLASWDLATSIVPATWEDTSVGRDTCYRYSLRVIDNVGNDETWGPGPEFMTEGAGIQVTPAAAGATTVTEGAAAGIVLKAQLRVKPTSDVTLAITGDGQVQASPASITFTAANWNVPRDVTVVAVDDQLDEPTASAVVRFVSSVPAGGDLDYANLEANASVQVADDDEPGIVLELPPSGLAVAEPGSSVTYGVRPATRPHTSVTIAVAAASGQVGVSATGPLTFTSSNWQTAQQVTVRAIDDPDVEGPHVATVDHVASGSGADGGYAGVTRPGAATITDDDAPGFVLLSADGATVDEANPAATHPVSVRLQARPAGNVVIDLEAPDGQVVATPARLTFTPADWNVAQAAAVAAVADTRAEPNPHESQLLARATSGEAAWASLAEQATPISVRDDDPAGFVTSPGARWTLDAEGRLLLEEAASLGSVIRIRAVGDPSSDVRITPVLSPEGQLEATPKSAVIPAGSTNSVLWFSVRAVADGTAETAGHAAKVSWRITTVDPLYAATAIPATFVRITDEPSRTLLEETSDGGTSTGEVGTPDGGGDGRSGSTANPTPQPPAGTTGDEGVAAPTPAPPGETVADPGETVENSGELPHDSDPGVKDETSQEDEAAEEDEGGGAIGRQARRMKRWASENKGKAAVAASATGSAAAWAAAKPLAMVGKALSTAGGGLGNPPPGLGQLRHLAKARSRRLVKAKARRFWRGKRRGRDRDDLPDEDDWDDFLWGDRAA